MTLITSLDRKPPITEWHLEPDSISTYEVREELGGKSLFHWCPNTHLHSSRRMFEVKRFSKGPWNRIDQIASDYYCPECGIREYFNWAAGLS